MKFSSRIKYGPSFSSNPKKVKGISWFIEVMQVVTILENNGRVKVGACYID